MSAPYIIPFNHQPVNVNANSTTYTVPSGKYARVTCTAYAYVFITSSIPNSAGVPMKMSESQNSSITIWAKEGDVFTKSVSVPSGSGSSGAGVNGSTTVSALINATSFMQTTAQISSIGATGAVLTLNGGGDVVFTYEEYNAIS